MNRIISFLKKKRLSQILMTFLAGVLLIFSTACSTDKVLAKNPRPEVPDKAVTSPSEGGMNEFSDVDPRTPGINNVKARAKELRQNAEQNIIDQTSNVSENTKRILDKKGENASDFGKNLKSNTEEIKDKTQKSAEDLAKGTKQGAENIKSNTSDALKDVGKSAKQTADDVKQNVQENTPNPRGLSLNARQAADDIKENAKAASKDVSDSAKEVGRNTSNFVQDKLNQAAQGVQESFDKTSNALKDVVD
jgi:ElaB/YqjD/DUF883 family membrane-anchored ribosome-binding protein